MKRPNNYSYILPTLYEGYNFRSRREARWAVFFDTAKIKWEYEPEGFKIKDGFSDAPDSQFEYGAT